MTNQNWTDLLTTTNRSLYRKVWWRLESLADFQYNCCAPNKMENSWGKRKPRPDRYKNHRENLVTGEES